MSNAMSNKTVDEEMGNSGHEQKEKNKHEEE